MSPSRETPFADTLFSGGNVLYLRMEWSKFCRPGCLLMSWIQMQFCDGAFVHFLSPKMDIWVMTKDTAFSPSPYGSQWELLNSLPVTENIFAQMSYLRIKISFIRDACKMAAWWSGPLEQLGREQFPLGEIELTPNLSVPSSLVLAQAGWKGSPPYWRQYLPEKHWTGSNVASLRFSFEVGTG